MDMHTLKPINNPEMITCVSTEVLDWHHNKHQKGYVDKRNEIEKKLETADKTSANANFSEWRELKKEETFNASGMILHEAYWDSLGGEGIISDDSAIARKIEQDFGSFEKWRDDFIATAKAARGWVILCYDFSDNKLHNFLVDSHQDGAVWGAVPLLVLDVWEHSYYREHGPDRITYITRFMQNIDWERINEKFEEKVPQ